MLDIFYLVVFFFLDLPISYTIGQRRATGRSVQHFQMTLRGFNEFMHFPMF